MGRRQSIRRSRGFTIVELMVAIAIVAILAAMAFPSFENSLRTNRLTTMTNQFVGAVALARTEAVRTTRGGGICMSPGGTSCAAGTDWSGGWMVWSDVNSNGTFEAGTDRVLKYIQGNPRIRVTGPAAGVVFDTRGRVSTGVQQTIDIQPTQCGSVGLRRTLTLSASGQLRKSGNNQTCT